MYSGTRADALHSTDPSAWRMPNWPMAEWERDYQSLPRREQVLYERKRCRLVAFTQMSLGRAALYSAFARDASRSSQPLG
jgi:hypothetical protein